MKKFSFGLIGLLAIPFVSGCFSNGNSDIKDFRDFIVPLYSLTDSNTTSHIENLKVKDVVFKIANFEQEVPYITINEYASLYDNLLAEGYESKINYSTWGIYKDNILQFYFDVDVNKKEITVAGDLTSTLKDRPDYSKTTLNYALKNEVLPVKSTRASYVYSYKDMGFRTVTILGLSYIPLSLFNLSIYSEANVGFFYNFDESNLGLYQYSDYSQLSNSYIRDGEELNAFSKIDASINKTGIVPTSLVNDKLSSVYYVFTNMYGLKSKYHFKEMKEYLEMNQELYDKFASNNLETFKSSLGELIASFDDGHTSVSSSSITPLGLPGPSLGEMWMHRLEVYHQLLDDRKAVYDSLGLEEGEVIYSEDSTLAFFPFNSFRFAYDAYDEDGHLTEKAYKEDTFLMLVDKFNQIKEKGTVKDVIVDLSTNTGGVLGIMIKILALISKHNRVTSYFKYDNLNAIFGYSTQVDTNQDGSYDEEDVFGDDFKIYLLTSELSFSCGNALPYLADKNNIATIIGRTSGGGECVVGSNVLSTGEYFTHSSLMHIGWYNDKDGFIGDEDGVSPSSEYKMDLNKYFDIENWRSIL